MQRVVRAVVATVVIGATAGAGPSLGAPEGAAASASAGPAVVTAGSPPPLTKGANAWVRVSVATLWRSRTSPRPVDAPALENPARIGAWLSDMTTGERRALTGRADTQVLLGDKVIVLRLRPRWVKVAVPDQPTPALKRGYPGWVPRRQLTGLPPVSTSRRATVVAPLAWLRTDRAGGRRVMRISFGTRLPSLGRVGSWVRVATPDGAVLRIRRTAVSVHRPGTPALTATRAGVVASATAFDGLDYLWAGRSGFGFDCSGLTSLVYRVHGVRIPRDAAPQSSAGRAVTSLRRGDLMFYANSGGVHHVSMYAGSGRMVHSPRTGSTVQVIATTTPPFAAEFAGARRFLG